MCKIGYVNLVFIIDESGSMSGSESDVIGGFNKTIKEQKEINVGECTVSFFTFNDKVKERFIGKKLNEIKELKEGHFLHNNLYSKSINFSSLVINNSSAIYNFETNESENDPLYNYYPSGGTAMNDAIGIAIDKIGKWLNDMPEEERPSKNLIVIMTDGEENSSKEYTLSKVQEMIKHQTEKYNWTFVYMGMDITTVKDAVTLGINHRSFSSKHSDDVSKGYDNISNNVYKYRCCASLSDNFLIDEKLKNNLDCITKEYETKYKIKIE